MKKFLILALLLCVVGVLYFDLTQYLSFDQIRAQLELLHAQVEAEPLQAALLLFLVYTLVTALSIPGAVPLTLVSGALFGLGWGGLLVSFASTLGATLSFLVARYLLRGLIEQRFGSSFTKINSAIEREGARYLFSLRLVPIFPFFLINLVMGLTRIKTWRFYWVSQLGMLPGTLIYVNAGRSLAELESPAGILSGEILVAFALMALLPWASKWLLDRLDRRRVYRGYPRPKLFDRNLIVIGGGAGGLVSAYIASAVKAKVSLIEGAEMGGDCLNRGCVPSKALIRSAKVIKGVNAAADYGIEAQARVDFKKVMQRVRNVIEGVAPHDSVERYTGLGVDVIQGWAEIQDPWTVSIKSATESRTLTAENIILATGAKPRTLAISGLDSHLGLTSDTLWDYLNQLETAPKALVILGAGPVAVELAQALNRLGVDISLVARADRILSREPAEAAQLVQQALIEEGVKIYLNALPTQALSHPDRVELSIQSADTEQLIEADRLLFALGREASLAGLGLDKLGFSAQAPELNDYLQTRFPHIFAVGDLAGPHQFTHAAAHQAWYASVNALFGQFKRFKVDYSLIPRVTFSDPQIAAVGIDQTEANKTHTPFEVTRFDLEELDRAIAEGATKGYIEVLTAPNKDRILGVTIVAENAGDLIGIFCVAMRHKLGMNKLLSVVHAYPTMNEASKYVAGNWKRAHQPLRLLAFLKWWFTRRISN